MVRLRRALTLLWRILALAAVTGLAQAGPALAAAAEPQPMLRIEPGAHAGAVRRVAVDLQQGRVVTASDDKTARVWDLQSGQLLQVLRPPVGENEIGRLYAVAIHPTSRKVAVAGTTGAGEQGHRIYLFDASTGRMEGSFDALAGDIKRMHWTRDGQLLVAGYAGQHRNGNGVRFFDANGRLVHEALFDGGVYGIDVAASGLVVAAGLDKKLRVFQAASGRVATLRTLSTGPAAGQGGDYKGMPASVSVSPDGKRVAVGFRYNADPVRVLDLETGELVRTLQFPATEPGNLWAVAWTGDGRHLYTAGSAHRAGLNFTVFRHDALGGQIVDEYKVARDTISDLVALPHGGVVYTSQDGSWGVTGDIPTQLQTPSRIGDLRGAAGLKASADARRVGWTYATTGQTRAFDFASRTLASAHAHDLRSPRVSAGFLAGSSSWENVLTPVVNGKRVALDLDERSRSIAFLPGSTEALLGTNRAIRKLRADGSLEWRSNVNAEVLAMNVSEDRRLFVAAFSDATIRWFRMSDARTVLTLYVSPDGQWVAWTPSGFYDASAGADRLIGWSVNRGESEASDYFSLGRFRSRYHRPDLVDRVLETLDPDSIERAALATAPDEGPAGATQAYKLAAVKAQPSDQPSLPALNAIGLPPAPLRAQLPPVLGAVADTALTHEPGRPLALPFTLQADRDSGAVEVEARVNGRPARPLAVKLPALHDGRAQGALVIDIGTHDASVQLVARNANGYSEPLSFRLQPAATPTPSSTSATASTPASGSTSATASTPASGSTPASAALTSPAAFALPSAGPTSVPPPSSLAAASTPVTLPSAIGANPASKAALPAVVVPTLPPATSSPTQTPAALPAASKAGGPKAAAPRLFILAIGISQYRQPDYQLGLAAKDARDFARALEGQRGTLYSDVTARVLVDGQATRGQVLESLRWLAEVVGPQDVGMLFMAGHGLNDKSQQYYFLPHDGLHTDLKGSSVHESVIRDTLSRMRGRALFFVDTCFAGNVVGSSPGGLANSSRELARLASELASTENGVVVFASSAGRQKSEENDAWGNGAFTKALVEGLGGRADLSRSGRITFKALDYFVSEEVRRLTDGRQTPVTISPIGVPDFTLAQR